MRIITATKSLVEPWALVPLVAGKELHESSDDCRTTSPPVSDFSPGKTTTPEFSSFGVLRLEEELAKSIGINPRGECSTPQTTNYQPKRLLDLSSNSTNQEGIYLDRIEPFEWPNEHFDQRGAVLRILKLFTSHLIGDTTTSASEGGLLLNGKNGYGILPFMVYSEGVKNSDELHLAIVPFDEGVRFRRKSDVFDYVVRQLQRLSGETILDSFDYEKCVKMVERSELEETPSEETPSNSQGRNLARGMPQVDGQRTNKCYPTWNGITIDPTTFAKFQMTPLEEAGPGEAREYDSSRILEAIAHHLPFRIFLDAIPYAGFKWSILRGEESTFDRRFTCPAHITATQFATHLMHDWTAIDPKVRYRVVAFMIRGTSNLSLALVPHESGDLFDSRGAVFNKAMTHLYDLAESQQGAMRYFGSQKHQNTIERVKARDGGH